MTGSASPHNRILLGLLLGALAGVSVNSLLGGVAAVQPVLQWALANLIDPVGQVFLRLLFMVVIPLILSSLTLGVAAIGDLRRLGRVGGLTFGFFLLLSASAALLGLLLVNVLRPGSGMEETTRTQLLAAFQDQAREKLQVSQGVNVSTFVQIIPRNPVDAAARGDMLGVIFFSIALGTALSQLPAGQAKTVLGFLEGIAQAMAVLIRLIMKLAPFGVFALIFGVTARFGWEVLVELAGYVFTVLLGLTVFQVVGYGLLVRVLCGWNPLEFLRRIRAVMITGFSTSSSNATLPTTMEVAEEELGIPPQISGFVLPLGATMNMNGTALFEGVTVLFLAQVFGVPLDLGQQMLVVVLSVMTAIGTAGVPGGSIPLLAGVLATVGIPAEGIALVLGVDRILDMSRTVLNVSGDLVTAAFVSRRFRTLSAQSASADAGDTFQDLH